MMYAYLVEHYLNRKKVNEVEFSAYAFDGDYEIQAKNRAHKATKTTSWSDPHQWHGFMWTNVQPNRIWCKGDSNGNALILTRLKKHGAHLMSTN